MHYNSGVQNFWFYLLVEGGTGSNDNAYNYNVPSLGLSAAQQIAYRNLTVYLTSTSEYMDARVGAEQSAIDLFGSGSLEYQAVVEAWNAVGVPSSSPSIAAPDSIQIAGAVIGLERKFNIPIANQGTGLLAISNVTSTNDLVIPALTSFSVSELATYNLEFSFTPTEIGDTSSIVTIYSNADTVSVIVSLSGVEPPVMVVSPNSFSEALYSGSSITSAINISNIDGGSDLEFRLSVNDVPDPISYKKPDFQTLPSRVLPSTKREHEVVEAMNVQTIDGGFSDLEGFTVGFFNSYALLAEDLEARGAVVKIISYSISKDSLDLLDVLIIDDVIFSLGTTDLDHIIEWVSSGRGLWLEADDSSSIESLNYLLQGSGINAYYKGSYFDQNFTNFALHQITDSLEAIQAYSYGVYLTLESPALELIPETSTTSFSAISQIGAGKVFVLGNELSNDIYPTDNRRLANQAVDWLVGSRSWLHFDITSGVVPMGEQRDVEVTFDAAGLNGGTYEKIIHVEGNDPSNLAFEIPSQLIVTGAPIIASKMETVDFGVFIMDNPSGKALTIYNAGTDSLAVSGDIRRQRSVSN